MGACWGGLKMTSVGPSGLRKQASSCWMMQTDSSLLDRITGLGERGRERGEVIKRGKKGEEEVSTSKVWLFSHECN